MNNSHITRFFWKPFSFLLNDTSTSNYAVEAICLVSTLLCQRVQDSDSPRCVRHPTNLHIEDFKEEEEEDHEMEGDETDDTAVSMDDWEDSLTIIDDDNEDGDEESGSSDKILDDCQEYFILLSDSQKAVIEKLKQILHPNSWATDSEVLETFAGAILQVFVSQPADSDFNLYHTPIEAYLISRGI
jgi:hypothetical protein